MNDHNLKEAARPQREWKAPTLMVFAVEVGTKNFTNPALNNDSATNYYTSAS